MDTLTLGNFLHHTSGLTNGKHTNLIPEGDTSDMLRRTVEMTIDTKLAFSPGDHYEYGTINYDVLGLVIEVVSGLSYEDFMKEQVLEPLGLYQTYMYEEEAEATGQLAQGYRSSFFITTPYDAPKYRGNKPAGYIISCTEDMVRWIGIQLGTIQDIPEIFKTVIEKSHQSDMSVSDVGGMYYAAGWQVNTDQTIIEHSGGNPNFATQVSILSDEQTGICLLSNGASTNISMVVDIKGILDGNLVQIYKRSATQILDISLSIVTIMSCILAVMFVILGLRRRSKNNGLPIGKKRVVLSIIWLLITVALITLCWIFPKMVGVDWSIVFVWQTYSILTGLISLVLLSVSITWYVSSKRH